MIPQETIQQIIDATRIEEVVGDFVQLKKRGVNLLGNCPFHNEKTPSFTVSPAKGIFKCFGCGKAGSPISFIMEHEHKSYPEALKYLAHKYQIEIQEEEQTAEQIAHYNERESMLQVMDFANKYFVDQLWESDQGKSIGLNYLTERGMTTKMIKKFQLGYSPDEWTAFTDHAIQNAQDIQLLEKTGMTIVRENDKKFDRFKGRVMFPIHNLTGQVIAFGGRTLSTDKKQAKYLNSPESELYHKSKVLYGISLARNEIVRADNCFLVEGYTDVISLFDAGVENVVASSGTALTLDQIKLIKRFTNNITVLYDGDFAGIKAGLRGIDMILSEGMNVRVVMFPEGEDPDSFTRSHRSSEVKDYITHQAQDFISFKTNVLSEEAQNDPIKRSALIKEIVQTISVIPDAITRQVYVRECSNLLEMPEQTLLNELNKHLRKKFKDGYKSDFVEPNKTTRVHQQIENVDHTLQSRHASQEENLARLLLKFGHKDFIVKKKNAIDLELNVAAYIIDQLELDNLEFENATYKNIYNEFVIALNEERFKEYSHFINHPDPKVARFSVDSLIDKYELSSNWMDKKQIYIKSEEEDLLSQSVQKSVLSYKLSILERDIKVLQDQLKGLKEDEVMMNILSRISKKESQKKYLSGELGRIVLR